uniref:Basic helix-loop-helix DNA-binding superfamily protein 120a n=1 Tax=Eriobotrya japonica TaxID=32224 RepID=A0A5P9Q401_9ROSA|nr:basic helix-loop-helix DNA-binding superfamily protein 120a [Eriobotrya japonica]
MLPNAYHRGQRKDLVFQTSTLNYPHREDMMHVQHLMPGHEVFPEGKNPSRNKMMGKGKQQQHRMILSPNSNNNGANPSDGKTERNIVRRDNERQRRQLMAALNASLRSLLPYELIKGKRSITEHMDEAVNYINHMKAKIEELNAKKEKINKKLYECDSQDFGLRNESSGHNFLKYSIMVCPTRLGGVEVLVSSSCGEEEGLLLSGVLKVLIAEGLSVVECASTRVNESLFHTIQCEVVNDLACLDLSELHLKLTNYCNSG